MTAGAGVAATSTTRTGTGTASSQAPRRGPLHVRRLRTQLLLGFALVALVALAAGGTAVVWLMLGYRAQAVTQRLRDAGASAGVAEFNLQRQGLSPDVIAAAVAAQVPLPSTHVLLLDGSGTIVADASNESGSATATASPSFVGKRLDVPAPEAAAPFGPAFPGGPRLVSPQDRVVVWRGSVTLPGTGGYLFVSPAANFQPGPPDRGGPGRGGDREGSDRGGPFRGGSGAPGAPGAFGSASPQGPPTTYRVVLAIPPQGLPSAWEELAPGLAIAAGVALFAAAVVAWLLAGSIARPIRAVTQATARIARGEPHQPIPEEGVEEVTELARGFNTMVREVERSQRTLRDFVANASHELRTPLTAIQGFSQAVADGVLEAPEPTRDAAALIHREADRMRRLVEDLLLLSKMEARDRPQRRDAVDIAELIDALAQRTQFVAGERGLRLVLDLPDRLLVSGDASQLEHLFGNLLGNAEKYSPDGATITVRGRPLSVPPPRPVRAAARGTSATPRSTGDQWVEVRVHNTGSFIPPEDLPRIFDRFYRVDKSRSRDVAGSGLGLAIAREITDRHGGTIRAESDPQSGTTFVVILPARASTSGTPEVRKQVTENDGSAVLGARPGLTPAVAPAAPTPPAATATAARRG